MDGFYGQFNIVMDEKGRIIIPSKLRPIIPKGAKEVENFILTKGLDGCLALYPRKQWELIQQRLDSLSFTQKDFRYFSRLLHSVAILINLDRQGRLLIPSHLQQEASLKKEILVIGAYRWIEFWNPDIYRKYLDQYGQSYEEVAEKLFDINHWQKE
ncbi:MAG: division/cell wall cluster transcriptional repressor MraZ [candidate division Zixibacteria bacterium]|nr:division/cell wall cluster transcriptional repressor MraZ [candidate division Zixibacteria bacterium]